jgi:phosphoribosyl-AMP cyclohydrolase
MSAIADFDAPPAGKHELEQGARFTPRFDANGLVTAVVTDATDGTLLMVAHMNEPALKKTLETGKAHYWSRSRGKLWMKGETSGNVQSVLEIRTDCDQDTVWLKVTMSGHDAACHTGQRSCFYRAIEIGSDGRATLKADRTAPRFNAGDVYR